MFDCDDISVMVFCLEQDCFLDLNDSDTTRQILGCCVILMQSFFMVLYKAMYVDAIITTKWNTLSSSMLNSVLFLSIS